MPEELDEQSLFDQATSDEVVTEQPSQLDELKEAKAEIDAKAEQARDEAGRFAKEEKPVLEAEKSAVDDNAAQVPSWRVREINDEKRALADKVANLEAERQNWQRLVEETRNRPTELTKEEQAAKAAKPDPLLDPEGYEKYLENRFEERLLNDRREFSLANAHKTYKGEFEEAYTAAQKQIDPALKARMQQSRDPGETLMEWHRELKTRAEVGSDLTAYKQKLRDEALKDPEFQKAALAAWREQTQPQNNGRPRVDLPPSLNGASRSNSMLRSTDGDVPDGDLWNQVTG